MFSFRYLPALLMAGGMLAAPLTAEAVSIRNLDQRDHTVQVQEVGRNYEVVVPARGTLQLGNAPARNLVLKTGPGHAVQAEGNDVYAIWPKDGLVIQRRDHRMAGH
jgi:hypothetical protein